MVAISKDPFSVLFHFENLITQNMISYEFEAIERFHEDNVLTEGCDFAVSALLALSED